MNTDEIRRVGHHVVSRCPAGASVLAATAIRGGAAVALSVAWARNALPVDITPLMDTPGLETCQIRLNDEASVQLRVVVRTATQAPHSAKTAVKSSGPVGGCCRREPWYAIRTVVFVCLLFASAVMAGWGHFALTEPWCLYKLYI